MGAAIAGIATALIAPRPQQQQPQVIIMPAERKPDNTPYFLAAGAILVIALIMKR
jgi:hypothetical protein